MRHIGRGFTASRKRFIVPVLGIGLAHFVVGLALYYSLQAGMSFGGPFLEGHAFGWIYMFSGWDSNYYRAIALNWYPAKLDPVWAYSPLYPATVRLLNFLGLNVRLGAFSVAAVCGFASIMVFQAIAEHYMVRTQALLATVLYFLFPPVFVFSFVSYSDPMFILFALLTWHFHLKRSDLKASATAGLCALSRPEGFLLVIPLLYDYVSQRQFKRISYAFVPLSAVAGWELYGYAQTGVWLPSLVAGKYWNTPEAQAVRLALQQLVMGNLSSVGVLLPYRWLIVAIVAILGIALFLAWRDWKIDEALSIYLLASMMILGSMPSAVYRSFPRILSIIFPVGLPMHTRKLNVLVALTLIFLMLDYVAWLAFLTDGFY